MGYPGRRRPPDYRPGRGPRPPRKNTLNLARLERHRGFFHNKYDPRTGETLKTWPQNGKPVRPFSSTVDNGWIAAALIMIRNARPALRGRAEGLLRPMDFGCLHERYDPADPVKRPGQLHGGYWPDDRSFATLHGMLNTEPRIASYIGIAWGQIPAEHDFRIFRTPPPGQVEQQQVPRGQTRSYRGVSVLEGHYTYRGIRVVPSWGGSMFEALMVPLFVPEARWAPRSWGINHPAYVRAQIRHGLDDARYGYWGFSPAEKPEGGYRTSGVDARGASREGDTSNNDDTQYDPAHPPPPAAYTNGIVTPLRGDGGHRPQVPPPAAYTNGVVTPHASSLALEFAPREAMINLAAIAQKFPDYGPHGFHDSVNVSSDRVSNCVIALDQGVIMAAIANALADGAMRRAFAEGEIESAIRPLIAPEGFTASPPPSGVAP